MSLYIFFSTKEQYFFKLSLNAKDTEKRLQTLARECSIARHHLLRKMKRNLKY